MVGSDLACTGSNEWELRAELRVASEAVGHRLNTADVWCGERSPTVSRRERNPARRLGARHQRHHKLLDGGERARRGLLWLGSHVCVEERESRSSHRCNTAPAFLKRTRRGRGTNAALEAVQRSASSATLETRNLAWVSAPFRMLSRKVGGPRLYEIVWRAPPKRKTEIARKFWPGTTRLCRAPESPEDPHSASGSPCS